MSVPVYSMKLDESGYHWAIQVRVFNTVAVTITFENLQRKNDKSKIR